MPLERRNTISTVPSHVTLPSKPRHHHSVSFGTAAMSSFTPTPTTHSSSSYISIKEIISATAASSSAASIVGSSEISIRNHLVKQAAWAYLRPRSTSQESSSGHLLGRVAAAVFEFPLFSLLRSAARAVVNAFNCFSF